MQLHPLSIPYRAVERGLQMIVGIAIAGIAGSGSIGLEGIAAFVLFLLVGIGAAVGWQVAYFRRFEYRLTEDTVDIDSGVLSRRSREIPYGRIQNVDIRQNVVQRVLGIAEVRLETAGGGETEAQLKYVAREAAGTIQETVTRRKRGETADDADGGERAVDRGEQLFAMQPRELAVLGVVSMDLRLLSIVAVPLSFAGPSLLNNAIPETATLAILVAGLVVLVVGSAVVSGLLSMARYYGFVLDDHGEEYRYERGLLQRFSGSIPKDKVQTLTLTENVLARRLGYASLTIETAGYAGSGQQGSGGSQSAIPIAQRDHAIDLARRIESFESRSFQRPPKRARERYAARYTIAVGVLTAIAYGVVRFSELSFPWYGLALGLVVVPLAAHLKWAHRGYRVEDGYVITRNGFWSRRITVVPTYRIQTLVTGATIFQRRRRLATLVVDTAGTYSLLGDDAQAVDIDAGVAEGLRGELADGLQQAVLAHRRERRQNSVSPGPDSQ